MNINIKNPNYVFMQYGKIGDAELRAVFQYEGDARRFVANAMHSDFLHNCSDSIRLILVDTYHGHCLTRVLEAQDV